ncbi:MAG TPA: 30S ribosome-binding factor RbfA [Vicinamibacteria bacterium]|jgi:ribosome-binding factor A
MSARRTERLGEEIREGVAEILGGQLKDPRIGFVTVTRVSLTPDLRTARVHVGVLGDAAQRDKTLAGLRQAAGFVRRTLGRRLRVRHTPELLFEYDEGLDATDRVARLLEEVRAESDTDSDTGTGTDSDTGKDSDTDPDTE